MATIARMLLPVVLPLEPPPMGRLMNSTLSFSPMWRAAHSARP
ncbi:hypothetical protein [Methylobacterium platani]|nr:hypothetical protein [Methylobacterium platani]